MNDVTAKGADEKFCESCGGIPNIQLCMGHVGLHARRRRPFSSSLPVAVLFNRPAADGILEPKFSHYRWKNEATGEVTYIGDRIKYQNGFGAWIYHTYECDLDASGEVVTGVRAAPGRFPQ